MTNPQTQWQQICRDYLAKVKGVLSRVSAEEKQQILDDIQVHLDERYHELNDDERTWENFQQIITELGPVEDYADLLEAKSTLQNPQTTKRAVLWILGGVIIALILGFAAASIIIPLRQQREQSKRPVVVSTSPETLSTSVDPATTEITVTFDKPMMNFNWSWVGGGEHYPETTGEPRYDADRLTCTMPVKLKPGHWYWIGINSEKFVNFKTETHIPAVPYAILFATADEEGNPTEIPEEYIHEAKRINSK